MFLINKQTVKLFLNNSDSSVILQYFKYYRIDTRSREWIPPFEQTMRYIERNKNIVPISVFFINTRYNCTCRCLTVLHSNNLYVGGGRSVVKVRFRDFFDFEEFFQVFTFRCRPFPSIDPLERESLSVRHPLVCLLCRESHFQVKEGKIHFFNLLLFWNLKHVFYVVVVFWYVTHYWWGLWMFCPKRPLNMITIIYLIKLHYLPL